MGTEDLFVIESFSNEEKKKDDDQESVNLFTAIRETITLEPLIFCYLLSYKFSAIVNNLRKNPYSKNESLEGQEMDISQHIILIISSIWVLFLGSFSDHYKMRKPFLLIATFGQFVQISGILLNEELRDIRKMNIINYVPFLPLFFGGYLVGIAAIFAYIADVSSSKSRTTKIGIVFILQDVTEMISLSLEDIISKFPRHTLLVAIVINMIGSFYIFFYINEPKQPVPINGMIQLIKDMFNPFNIIGNLKVVLKTSDAKYRSSVLLMLIIVFMCTFVADGESFVHNNYVHIVHNTDKILGVKKYIETPVRIIGNSLGLFLFIAILEYDDNKITVISFINKIIGSVVFMCLKGVAGFYVGIFISIFRGISSITTYSYLTKIISENDFGKICSLYAILASYIAPVISQVLYKQAYSEDHPNTFFVIGIILYGFGVFVLLSIYFKNKKKEKLKRQMSEQKEEEIEKCSEGAFEMKEL